MIPVARSAAPALPGVIRVTQGRRDGAFRHVATQGLHVRDAPYNDTPGAQIDSRTPRFCVKPVLMGDTRGTDKATYLREWQHR
jgi:hypothetical protein